MKLQSIEASVISQDRISSLVQKDNAMKVASVSKEVMNTDLSPHLLISV